MTPRPLYLPVRVLVTAETFTLSSNIIMDTSTFLLRYAAPAPHVHPTQAGLQLPPLQGPTCLCVPLRLLSEPFCTFPVTKLLSQLVPPSWRAVRLQNQSHASL